MTTVEDLEQEVARLRSELIAVERKLYRARCDAADVHIGDRVRGTGRFAGVVIRVQSITHLKSGKTWVAGWQVAKGGTVTSRWRDLLGAWEHVA